MGGLLCQEGERRQPRKYFAVRDLVPSDSENNACFWFCAWVCIGGA